MTKAHPVTDVVTVIDGTADVPIKYPRALGRQPLDTVGRVREEMARVYRAVASGKISAKQGSTMSYMLSQMVKTLEIEKLEPALELVRRLQQDQRR